jgi:hypothetical protein
MPPGCQNCGAPTCRVIPIYKPSSPQTVAAAFASGRVLPRSALTNEQNAAIPWGEHPQDNDIQTWCEECAA